MLASSDTRFVLSFKKHEKKKLKKGNFIQRKIHTTRKIQHKVGVLGAGLEALKFSHVKVQKGTTKIGETSSLIRHMYMLRYIVIRTNQYIVMHALRGVLYYCGALECPPL